MSSITQEALNPHPYPEELNPSLPYEHAVNSEPANTIQEEGVRDSLGRAKHARLLGAASLATLAAFVPAASTLAAGKHEASHHHPQHAERTHHKKHHHGHNKKRTFDSSGVGPPAPHLVAGPAPVQPTAQPSLQELFQYAYDDANATWGISTPPCNGNVTYQAETSNFNTSQSWVMESTWHDQYTLPGGAIRDAINVEGPDVNPQNFSGCTMYYNTQERPNTSLSDMTRNWTFFCSVVSHEWQHFLNKYNDETPIDHGTASEPTSSISYPSWTGENTPNSCLTNAPPGVTQVIYASANTWLIEPAPSGAISDTITTSSPGPIILAP